MTHVVFVGTDAAWGLFMRSNLPPQIDTFSVVSAPIQTALQDHSLVRPSVVVSPANSVGYMGAGIDKLILECIGCPAYLQKEVQLRLSSHNGYVPLGSAAAIDLATLAADPPFDYLVLAPTMTVPHPIAPDHARQLVFDTTWNALVAAKNISPTISTVFVPAFGIGWGRVPPYVSAASVLASAAIFSWDLEGFSQRDQGLIRSAIAFTFLDKDLDSFEKPEHIEELTRCRSVPHVAALLEWIRSLNP